MNYERENGIFEYITKFSKIIYPDLKSYLVKAVNGYYLDKEGELTEIGHVALHLAQQIHVEEDVRSASIALSNFKGLNVREKVNVCVCK